VIKQSRPNKKLYSHNNNKKKTEEEEEANEIPLLSVYPPS
jgi:hypothetical protein